MNPVHGWKFYIHNIFYPYPRTLPIQAANQAPPCVIFYSLSKSSCPCSSPQPPPHFYRPTPNHLHSYDPYAQTISIYHASPPQPRSENTKKTLQDLTSLNSYPSETLHLTIICSALSRQCRFSAFIALVSLSYVNTLWTQALKNLSFLICYMMHHGLSEWAIAP